MTIFDPGEFGGIDIAGTAPAVFVAGGGQVDSNIVVEWDFDNDGDFSEAVEDITSYVVTAETQSGRDFASLVSGQAGAGQLKVALRNDDDRFSFFNAASPLNAAPNSLRTGRKLRIRTAESTPDDPLLLARDRFNRPDGNLGTTETGQAWTARAGVFRVVGEVASTIEPVNDRVLATISLGVTSYYVQGTIRQVVPSTSRDVGFVVRYTDLSNYTLVRYEAGGVVRIVDRNGGSDTTLATYNVQAWEGMTLGAGVVGTAVTAYVGGVAVASATAASATGTHAGLYAFWGSFTGRSPELDDFHVWEHVAPEVEGVLFTGDITDVDTSVTVGPDKVVMVSADGVLARVARAEIAAPRLPLEGAPTGLVVGDVLARAGMLHPPAAGLDAGTITTGPIGIDDGDGLTLARHLEETERGFLHETNEGQVGYDDRAARATATSQAYFSDTPTAGQFRYSQIEPADHKVLLVNRVTAGVAADAPFGITETTPSGTQHVDITIPTVSPGDLLVVFIAGSHTPTTDLWTEPIWWVRHRHLGRTRGMRVYSHFCDGTEDGEVVRFFDNPAAIGGLWVASMYRIQGWYESYNNGIAMGQPVRGSDPAGLVHGWGRAPTLFLVAESGHGAGAGGMSFDTAEFNPPDGYADQEGAITSSGVPSTEAGILTFRKIDCTETEDPTPYSGLSNATVHESVVFAVRGYNGPHTKATLQNPQTTGGDGRFVTVEDIGSQDDHNLIRDHVAASNLFASETTAEAYCDTVLAMHADDRPVVSVSFYATSDAAHRAQAIRRRVGDKIRLKASGETGLGIDSDMFIETVSHRWSNAAKLWECTWQLSPA